MEPTTISSPTEDPSPSLREISYEYSRNVSRILEHVQGSLLVSTYQAGKLVVVGVRRGKVDFSFHTFEQAMGVAVRRDRIAVSSRALIWFLSSVPEIANRIEPVGEHDGCFVTRSAHVTGAIDGHEIAWVGQDLWIVNTLFSCLCTLHDSHSFIPKWRPPFISSLAAEDRCHLNGLALAEGRPRYVTAMAESDTPQGWRPEKLKSGCLIDVTTGAIVARGFAMPHSPRVHRERIWLLDSGTGRLVTVEPTTGQVETVAELPGYTRGLALSGHLAFVGLSKIRETAVFGGVPIAARLDELKCGVGVVDIDARKFIALLEFKSGVDEIFDVQLLPGVLLPALSGPYAAKEGGKPIWTVPETGR